MHAHMKESKEKFSQATAHTKQMELHFVQLHAIVTANDRL